MNQDWKRTLAVGCAALLLGACTGKIMLTRVGTVQRAKPPSCKFDLFTSSPQGQFIEVGTIDLTAGYAASNWTNELSEFYRKIRPGVCVAGGDAAIALANGVGQYVKATVLKRKSAQQSRARPSSIETVKLGSDRPPSPSARQPGAAAGQTRLEPENRVQTAAAPAPNASDLSVEQRLTRLKRLREKELISEAEFQQQRKVIVDSL